MTINYDYKELYEGKADSFLDHEVLSSLLDYYSQSIFSEDWNNLTFKDADDTFAESLEEGVLKGSFDSYWADPSITQPPVLYIKTIDSNVIVEKLGYQFSISNEEAFPGDTTPKGFPILQYKEVE